MLRIFGFLALLVMLGFGCSSPRWVELPSGARISHTDQTGRVGTYVSNETGFNTSSYWVVGPRGVIVIDTQFLLSAASELINHVQKITGKPVVMAVILHPNPDKFNGTAVLQRRGIKVLTSRQVLDLIPAVHKDRHYWFFDRFKPDYPDRTPQPDSFGDRNVQIGAAGITLNAYVMGPGASLAHVVLEYKKHVFTGDLISNGHHAWLELGKVSEWLQRLAEIKALKPRYVHPGRGASGGVELVEHQINYLKRVVDLVNREHPQLPVDEIVIGRIKDKIMEIYPGYGNDYFLEVGLPAVWATEAKLGKSLKP